MASKVWYIKMLNAHQRLTQIGNWTVMVVSYYKIKRVEEIGKLSPIKVSRFGATVCKRVKMDAIAYKRDKRHKKVPPTLHSIVHECISA